MCSVGEECNCYCHTGMVQHCAPCCNQCRYCRSNIRMIFFDEHVKECKAKHDVSGDTVDSNSSDLASGDE